MDFEVVKSGWLFRQSSILKRWKRCWFVLYRDGYFKYYETPNQNVAEAVISICQDCSDVLSEVADVAPPSYLDKDCLFCVISVAGDTWILCAESPDDKKAWEISLNDARIMQPVVPPPPYTRQGCPPPSYYSSQQVPQYAQPYAPGYVYQYPGQTTFVYGDQPRYYRRDGSDVAMGMVAGAALGSLVWGPLLWW